MIVSSEKNLPAFYYPMLIPEGDGSIASQLRIWDKFDQLSLEKQEVITSVVMANKIFELQKKFGFSNDAIGLISLMIRNIFFGELTLDQCREKLVTVLNQDGNDSNQAAIVADFIQREILNITLPKQQIASEKNQNPPVKKSLLKALSEYPRLGDQLITNEKIKIKSQAEPVRPSLSNWIHYYREELGIGFHDQVTRGHFLFQSENGKRLSAEERERINLILKSIEEEFPIDIDADRQTIVFPVKQTGAPTAPFGGAAQPATNPLFPRQSPVPARPVKPFQPAVPQDLPTAEPVPTPSAASKPSFFDRQFRPAKNVAGDTLHFSTGHVLPGEKNAESGVAAPAAAPQSRPTVSTPPPSSFRPRGIVQDRGAALPRSPYSIRPLRMRDDDEVAS